MDDLNWTMECALVTLEEEGEWVETNTRGLRWNTLDALVRRGFAERRGGIVDGVHRGYEYRITEEGAKLTPAVRARFR